ncbi:MAG: thioredoxin family protein [Cyclobacteriaceae bacterium]
MKYIRILWLGTFLILCAYIMINHTQSSGNLSNSYDQSTYLKEDGQGIDFLDKPWIEVLEKARNENKFIFLDIYASWCGPCKKLKKTTFADPQAGEFFNERFINVAMDAEKGEGKDLANRYKVRSYPTLIIFDSAGNVVATTTGYKNTKQLIRFASKIEMSEANP